MTMKVSLREFEYEGTRYYKLFGTPERTAKTLYDSYPLACGYCAMYDVCGPDIDGDCVLEDYETLLEWLRGGA